MLLNILKKLSSKFDQLVWYLEIRERNKQHDKHYKKK